MRQKRSLKPHRHPSRKTSNEGTHLPETRLPRLPSTTYTKTTIPVNQQNAQGNRRTDRAASKNRSSKHGVMLMISSFPNALNPYGMIFNTSLPGCPLKPSPELFISTLLTLVSKTAPPPPQKSFSFPKPKAGSTPVRTGSCSCSCGVFLRNPHAPAPCSCSCSFPSSPYCGYGRGPSPCSRSSRPSCCPSH